jgi:acylphosphatase
MEKKVRAHAIIRGRVQGVFFRMETLRTADRYGVYGWVRNRRDGTVEAMFEGDESRVMSILEWCKEGPPSASVNHVDVEWEAHSGEFKDFEIRHGDPF